MATVDRYFKKLQGSAKEIKGYIKDIIDEDPKFFISYVMGVNENDECLWCCQPGFLDDRVNFKMVELKKVYVWYSHIGCQNPIEGIYIR